MLNKLLKRCMPWMDKGRWYKIRVNTLDEETSVTFDPVFENVTVTEGSALVSIPSNISFQIIDARAIIVEPSSSLPNFIAFSSFSPEVEDSNTLMFPVDNGVIFDYWLFMRPLER